MSCFQQLCLACKCHRTHMKARMGHALHYSLRDASLDFKGGSRKFGSGQVFFFSSLARKVFLFSVPNGASFFFFSSRWGKFFFLIKFVFNTHFQMKLR